MIVKNTKNIASFTLNGGDFVIIPAEDYKELLNAKSNDEYRKKLERSYEQIQKGEFVRKTMEELRAME